MNHYNYYLSSDEAEVKEELEEPFIMENGYEGDLPSPVIPSLLLEEQVKLSKKTTFKFMLLLLVIDRQVT